jgi:hypothetical protein
MGLTCRIVNDTYSTFANDLTPQLRALIYIFAFNIFPRISALNEAKIIDIYILCKIFHEEPLLFTPLFIMSMWEVVASGHISKAYVFPFVILQILQAFRVSTEGEIEDSTIFREIITEQTLSNCGYKYNN